MKKIIIITIVIIILLLLYLYYNYSSNNTIIYLSSNETADFLMKDEDNYVNNFSDFDLYARKINSKKEYLNIIFKSALSFNENQKKMLENAAKQSDIFLSK